MMQLPHLTHLLAMCLFISSALNIAIGGSSNDTRVSASACYAPDREALVSVARTAGFFNYNGSWHGDDCCSWDGITCSHVNAAPGGTPRRITNIYIEMDLTPARSSTLNAFSTSLCNLSALTAFSLSVVYDYVEIDTANISIPECVGTHLTLLNDFSIWLGEDGFMQLNIPASFSRLSTLQTLELANMRIDAQSLRHIVSLPSLVELSLWSCPLVPSSLPLFTTPHTLSNLTSLILSHCSLSGPLPPFTNMPLLQLLGLYSNSLISTLEDFILHSNISALTSLYLTSNYLSGSLPESTSQQLPHLESLSVWGNHLSGPIPDRSLFLKNLTYLSLGHNHFSGPFPNLIKSPLLENIDLSYNHFSGALPESWQHLSSLTDLDLSGNTIIDASTHVATSRRLPEWLFRLPKLSSLSLASLGLQPGDCECHGMLSLLNQTLEELDVSRNNLTGPNVLDCFARFNISSIGYLSLSSNPLAFDLSSASVPIFPPALNMSNCSLFGSIPIHLLSLSTFYLDLSFNSLTGSHGKIHNQSLFCQLRSREVLAFPYIQGIFLSRNFISADVSFLISQFGTWTPTCGKIQPGLPRITFDASYNNLTGEISTSPSTSNLLSIFNEVLLNDNLLMGSISPALGGPYTYLQALNLNNNRLVGSIPTSILNITTLELLDLSYNQLEGNFTTLYLSIEQHTQLRVLVLSHNRIQGSIPPSFGSLTPNLQVIDLSNNNLSQEIPRNLQLPTFMRASPRPNGPGTLYEKVRIPVKGVLASYEYVLVGLTSLDLSYNHLIGTIPPQIGDFIGLRYLNLSANKLFGNIPTTFYKLHLLESMDLSCNQLQGEIPSSFSNLTSLEIFNVSFNEGLEGPIPDGSAFLNNMSFIGDPRLCGKPILDACSDPKESHKTTPSSIEEDKEEKVDNIFLTWMRDWIAIPGLILGIIVGFVGTLWILHAKSSPLRAFSITRHVSM